MVKRWFPSHISWLTLGLGLASVVLGAALGLAVATLDKPVYAIAGVLGAIVVLVCIINPKVGLYILVLITYLRLSDILVNTYNAPSIAKPFIGLLMGLVVLQWIFHEKPPRQAGTAFLLMVAYGLVVLLSLLRASNFDAAMEALDDFWKNGIIAVVVVILLRNRTSLRYVVWILIVSGIFLGTISVWQYLTGTFTNPYWGFAEAAVENIAGRSSGYRIAGPIGDPNFYAQIMLVIVPLAFSRFIAEKNAALKLLALWGTAVTILTVVFTFSRGAFLGLLVMGVILFYFHPPKPNEIVAMLVFFFFLIPYIPAEYTDRLMTLDLLVGSNTNVRNEVSFRGRASEYTAAILMFMDNPILGVGARNYAPYYQQYSRMIGLDPRSEARSAHSFYLETAAEMGLAGLIVLSLILWAVFRSVAAAWRMCQKAGDKELGELVLSVAVGFVGFMFAATFIHGAYPRYFWLLVGIGLSLSEVARKELGSMLEAQVRRRISGDV